MEPKHYEALITQTGVWVFKGVYPGDWPKMVPTRHGSGLQPIFQHQDTLVMRCLDKHLEPTKGMHTITLDAESRKGYTFPFDGQENLAFDYDPDDVDSDKAKLRIRSSRPDDPDAYVSWTFGIAKQGSLPIDPEFQVGPGGIHCGPPR